MSQVLPGGTITVVMTDIEGSTQRWDADADTMAAALRRHDEILAAVVEAHGGHRPLEQGEGDSVVAGFARASDAVAAASDAQVALDLEPWPGGLTLRVRMSIHTGEVRVIDGARYVGPVLNRAARLRALAKGGQVLVSAVARDLVLDSLPEGTTFIDQGWHRLRGLDRPEHVFELRTAGLDRVFARLSSMSSMSSMSSTVPVERTSFVGRVEELAELVDALGGTRLLTLTGTGGCGKTRLAQRVASLVAPDMDGCVRWVEAAAVGDGGLLESAVATALGVVDDPYRDTLDVVIERLGDPPAFLVLDNCEHLLDDATSLVGTLLSSCPDLRVLVTSREALNMPGELAWRVPSFPVEDAVNLFVERSREVQPDFALTDANADAVSLICRRLDGIPLAIELAAARCRVLSVAQIADAIDDRFRLLTGGRRMAVKRQRTLGASIDWSHDLLDDDERAVFRRLATFAGDFDLDAAEAVGAGEGVDAYRVLDLVGHLVDKSLLQVDASGDTVRFRMLESIRAYGRDRLIAAGEVESAQNRHLVWYADRVVALGPELTSAGHARRLDDLEGDVENIRSALGWAEISGDGARMRAMCAALTFFWMLHGHFREGARWCDRALVIDDGDSDRARTQWGRGYIAMFAGDYLPAVQLALVGYQTAEASGDRSTMARCLDLLATALANVDPPASEENAAAAVALAREADDAWCLADALQIMALAIINLDELDRAAPHLAEAFEIAKRLDNREVIARHWVLTARRHLGRGLVLDAETSVRRGLEIGEEVGDLGLVGFGTSVLAWALYLHGQLDDAVDVLEQAITRLREREAPIYQPFLASQLAHVLVAQDRPAQALGVLEGVSGPAEIAMIAGFLEISRHAARLAFDPTIADQLLAAPPAVAQTSIGELVTETVFLDARVRLVAGDVVGAETALHERLDHLVYAGLWPRVANGVELLAVAAALEGSDLECVRLFDAVANIYGEFGFVRLPQPPLDLDQIETAARRRLAEAGWVGDATVIARDDLVGYIRRASGERGRRPSSGEASPRPENAW